MVVVLDAAISLDGFWADGDGKSVFPVREMYEAGLVGGLSLRTGAIIMSDRSFRMSEDPDWYADNYELQAPVWVVTDNPPATTPKENDRLKFNFVETFPEALVGARHAVRDRDIMLIGEASVAQAALNADAVDEMILRIVPKVLGNGVPLFGQLAPLGFIRKSVTMTPTATHIAFVRDRECGVGV
jgi:dihydrofolate reductase